MTPHRAPLGLLDLVPVVSGSNPREALRNSLDLARRAEDLGYRRYWFAEHHLNPGVAGTSPPLLIALAAAATSRIRLGSGGVQSGHRTALSIVEDFGLLDAAFPGRIDLGVGRSGGRDFIRNRAAAGASADSTPNRIPAQASDPAPASVADRPPAPAAGPVAGKPAARRTVDGLLLPERPSLARLLDSSRVALGADLLQQAGARSAEYGDLLQDLVGLLQGTYRSSDGLDPRPVPGQGAGVELWVLGSSAGVSASTAGQLGLRFAANYHVSPATVLEAVEAYRAAFVPSADLDRPYVAVSADVVVGADDAAAAELAAGYPLWVRSIRSGQGAIKFPTPEEAGRHRWTEEDRALVADRVDTQFVGSPETVAAGLGTLQAATGADELVITTITHDHTDRVRSYELLAKEWFA